MIPNKFHGKLAHIHCNHFGKSSQMVIVKIQKNALTEPSCILEYIRG